MNRVPAALCTKRISNFLTFQRFQVLTFLMLLAPLRSQANVYATNVRLNGGFTDVIVPAPTNVIISYTLNEPATLGVSININSGATTVRTIVLTDAAPGTMQGSNYVVWDGLNNSSNSVSAGIYSVNITAASRGFSDWTQTSSEINNLEYEVWSPRSIAVNRNTNSPYYGRIFVANASEGFDPLTHPGDRVGIIKLNSDGTYASDGSFSTGGYDWPDNDVSPWKLEVGSDDRLYVNDLTNRLVFSFDQLVSTNPLVAVLRPDNYPTNTSVYLDGPFLTSITGSMQIWMADHGVGGAGVRRWDITPAGIVASNNTGITIVASGSAGGVDAGPEDIALDSAGYIYAIQDVENQGGAPWVVMRFPAYTNVTETNAEWRIGSSDASMNGATGIAVDPSSTYVAVAFKGYVEGSIYQNGSVKVFYATNGAPVMTFAAGDSHYDVAWDNAGNLYSVDGFFARWRTYSPPGTNLATTVAIPTVRIAVVPQPVLSNPVYNATLNQFSFTLAGEANSTYVILSSPNLVDWLPVATNTSAPATRQITNS